MDSIQLVRTHAGEAGADGYLNDNVINMYMHMVVNAAPKAGIRYVCLHCASDYAVQVPKLPILVEDVSKRRRGGSSQVAEGVLSVC